MQHRLMHTDPAHGNHIIVLTTVSHFTQSQTIFKKLLFSSTLICCMVFPERQRNVSNVFHMHKKDAAKYVFISRETCVIGALSAILIDSPL